MDPYPLQDWFCLVSASVSVYVLRRDSSAFAQAIMVLRSVCTFMLHYFKFIFCVKTEFLYLKGVKLVFDLKRRTINGVTV